MAKALKDILKQAHETIKGVRPSTTSDVSLGKDPGVDYEPKAKAEQDLIAKHSVQKWDDPNGNGSDVFQATNVKQAPFPRQSKGVYESKKAEDAQCNHSPKGTKCPIHGMNECMSVKPIKEEDLEELSKETLQSYKKKALALDKPDKSPKQSYNRLVGIARSARKIDAKEEVEQVDEVSKATLGSYTQAAVRDVANKQYALGKGEKVDTRKLMNRRKGIDKAVSKMSEEALDEISAKTLTSYRDKVLNSPSNAGTSKAYTRDVKGVGLAGDKLNPQRAALKGNKVKVPATEEVIDEVLTKSTTAGETISDFVHSDNPKFAGKSKEKRKQMALAAYYAKQREQKESYAVQPLIGSTDIAKYKTDDTQDEISMVKTELKAIANKTMHLLSNMPENAHVEPWVQAKIAQAKEMIGSVHDYIVYGDHEDEQTDTPMTFPNMSADVNTGQNV